MSGCMHAYIHLVKTTSQLFIYTDLISAWFKMPWHETSLEKLNQNNVHQNQQLYSVSLQPSVTHKETHWKCCKRTQTFTVSFCWKCRWQVTAKHAYTFTYVALHEVTWCMVAWCPQNLRRDGSSFMWHQTRQRCKYTTSVDSQKRAINS